MIAEVDTGSGLRAEVERLTRIVRQQGKENRRLTRAFAKLREERRGTHDLIKIAEGLQDEIDRLEAQIAALEDSRLAQAARDARRSRLALSVRYGHLHGALRALLADPAAADAARQALTDVESRKWVRGELERLHPTKEDE